MNTASVVYGSQLVKHPQTCAVTRSFSSRFLFTTKHKGHVHCNEAICQPVQLHGSFTCSKYCWYHIFFCTKIEIHFSLIPRNITSRPYPLSSISGYQRDITRTAFLLSSGLALIVFCFCLSLSFPLSTTSRGSRFIVCTKYWITR